MLVSIFMKSNIGGNYLYSDVSRVEYHDDEVQIFLGLYDPTIVSFSLNKVFAIEVVDE